MPERLAGAVQQFTDDVGRLHTPLAVLVALQKSQSRHAQGAANLCSVHFH